MLSFLSAAISCIISPMYIDIYCIILLCHIVSDFCICHCINVIYIDIFFFFRCVVILNVVISSGESDLNGRICGILVQCEVRMLIFEREKSESFHVVSELRLNFSSGV